MWERDCDLKCPVQGPPFLPFVVPWMSIWGCTREFPLHTRLFLAEGKKKVTLFSFRRASLWGLNQSKFSLCFLLWRDLLLLSAGPLVRSSRAGLWAKPSRIILNLLQNPYCLSSPVIHPNLLDMATLLYPFISTLQMQTFSGLKTRSHVQGWGAPRKCPPGGLGGDTFLLLLYLGPCPACICNLKTPLVLPVLPEPSFLQAPSLLFVLSPHTPPQHPLRGVTCPPSPALLPPLSTPPRFLFLPQNSKH